MTKIVLLMMDESMSEWRPRTSKLGSLTNCAFKLRKPTPLGEMLRTFVDCQSGCVACQDVAQSSEIQHLKKHYDEVPHILGRTKIVTHAAEVLRKVEDANVARNGWVGGDDWFGSAHSCVELRKISGVHSAFAIKNNKSFFPMKLFPKTIMTKHDNRHAGHWVVMETILPEVKLMVITRAWS